MLECISQAKSFARMESVCVITLLYTKYFIDEAVKFSLAALSENSKMAFVEEACGFCQRNAFLAFIHTFEYGPMDIIVLLRRHHIKYYFIFLSK